MLAWPKSGCIAKNAATTIAIANEICFPGGPLISMLEAKSHAETTINTGFRNSDGCTDVKPNEYQRTAPLPKSVPKNGSKAKATNVITNANVDRRRNNLGSIIDATSIAIKATPPKNA